MEHTFESLINTPKTLNWLTVLVSVVVAVSLLGIGVYLGANYFSKADQTIPGAAPASKKSEPKRPAEGATQPPPTFSPTATWKTYTDSVLGYSIQYLDALKVVVPQIEREPAVKLVVFTDMTVDPAGNPEEARTLYSELGGVGGIGGVVV